MSYLPPDKDSRTWPRIFTIAAIVFALVAAIFIVLTAMQYKSFAEATEQMQSKLVSVTSEYESVSAAQPDDSAKSTVSDDYHLYTAFKAGDEMASLQTSAPYLYADKDYDVETYNTTVERMNALLGIEGTEPPALWFDFSSMSFRPQWEFLSTYEFSDNTCSVVWKLNDPRGQHKLFAYTTATYDATTNVFSDVQVHLTKHGQDTQKQLASEADGSKR